ncbi:MULTISPECIES: DUF982 domain-containing protein [unclassified Mesorhizobium]|uniref:DUF982 domain-containing protein n=1 Tax=unclassified Mesorhizobium TaxID=325217 RepID=UPI001CC9CA41|nr:MULTISPECIES: DUF982 domain-containing protein [unclassified Mesorhizobium]MBZ9684678.1 DUF982 domain-containing protein [Mesorhizobium sp. CO1-1-2]MBZ9699197.1 DUF982 domain-containing protein [Mesorhizobium sp. CO1-1-9]MBZ9727814.1 DUF982 domain-containing protein [Mesorhizobium sp. CO1-1-11]MBZ9927552.1 DUF982 domain-containing protein [Mesorhizobium sp. BR1-1-4]
MSVHRFSHPVHVFVGLGFPHPVTSVQEAVQVLDEWTGRRSPIYEAAAALCRSALADKRDIEAACATFEAYAQAHGIQAPDPTELAVARAADDWMTAYDGRSESFANN